MTKNFFMIGKHGRYLLFALCLPLFALTFGFTAHAAATECSGTADGSVGNGFATAQDLVPSCVPAGSSTGYSVIFSSGFYNGQEFTINSALDNGAIDDEIYISTTLGDLAPGDNFDLYYNGEQLPITGGGSIVPAATSSLKTIGDVIINTTIYTSEDIFTKYWPFILVFVFIGGLLISTRKVLQVVKNK